MPAAVGVALFKLAVAVAVNYAVNRLTVAMQKRPVRPLQKIDVSYSGGLQPRRILYGNFRAGGLNIIPAMTTAANGPRLHQILALSDGEIESIDAVWFNNDRIVLATDTNLTTGQVTGGPYAGYALARPHLGTLTQVVDDTALQIPGWTTNHRGVGVAYIYFFWDQNNDVYKQGAPVALAEGKGKKIYDPRLDTSPGAHPTTSTYIAFSKNPALQLADFLTTDFAGGESAATIDWADVVTCANACDGTVTVPNPAGGTTTQARFTSSLDVLAPQTQRERDDTIATLARAFMGCCWFSDGQWHMRAGVYPSPVSLAITDDDWLGDSMSIATAQSRSQSGIFNTVRGSYVEELENAQPKSVPEVSVPAYVASDGEVMYTDTDQRTVRNVYEAERNNILFVRQSRRRIIISGVAKFKFSGLELYDVVNVTNAKLGWVSQPCRVVNIKHYQNFTVGLQVQEIGSTDFTDPTIGEYTTPSSVGASTSANSTPSPSNLAATSAVNAIIFTWTPPASAPVGVLYQLYEYTSPTPFGSATPIGTLTSQTSVVVPKSDTTVRYYWVVAKDPNNGTLSAQSPPTNGVPGNASSVSAGLNAIVTPGSASSSGTGASQTTGACAVTPSGGTAPYTYAWTFTSGGTGITITSPTSASTTFSATGMSAGAALSGTARCRVTDNVAAVYDVFVTVAITRDFAIVVNSTTFSSTGGSMTPAVCQFTVSNTGAIYWNPGSTYNWANGATPSLYEVRATLNSGTLQAGSAATGVWLNCGTSWQWTGARSPGPPGSNIQDLTIEIRLASTGVVQDNGTVNMTETIP